MSIHPRTPVIIGVGQVTDVPDANAIWSQRPQPLDLLITALERAASDTGSTRSLQQLDEIVSVASFTWKTKNPSLLVAEHFGLSDVVTRLTPTGGNIPQYLVHETSRRILDGEVNLVAVVGSEAMNAAAMARKVGERPNWVMQGDDVATPQIDQDDRIPFTADEYGNGLTLPVEVYPLFENARRARLGWTHEQQRERLGTLWSNFASVAAENPYAWIRTRPRAEAIAAPSSQNRMVASPYTKMLVANLPVDMGAAYLIASYETARSLGVARDRLIFPHLGAHATDHWYLSDRLRFDDSIAMRAIWDALRGWGAESDALAHLDLYSCFPTVVQTACDVLGIDAFSAERVPTVTGGLTFGGGPGNNYVTHSIATMVERLRQHEGDQGLVTGLGWFSTKHAWGTYSSQPPTQDFRSTSVQDVVDASPVCAHRQGDGDVTLETYTVVYGRDGTPQHAVLASRFDDGARVWSKSDDAALLEELERTERIGTRFVIRDGAITSR